MSPIIPFIHRVPAEEEADWLAALNAQADGYKIMPLTSCAPDIIASAEVALVANPVPADLARLPNLKWVQSLWAGVERMVGAVPDGVGVVRLVDPQLADTMAEAVLAWTLYLHRDMPAYAAHQKARRWQPEPFRTARDRKVALLGLGHLGLEAAARLHANGFQVLGWSRSAKSADLPFQTFAGEDGLTQVLGEADITVILLPLTDQTRGLVDAARFAQMKPGASIINFGRGPILDNQALLNALDGPLGHAVLDVFDEEPLPVDDPFWSRPDVTVLPHISGPTHVKSASRIVSANLAGYFKKGTVPYTVDFSRGY